MIREYGEDGDPILAARVAQAISARVSSGKNGGVPLKRTQQLAEVVRFVKAELAANPFQQPARLTFQAIRMHLNQERAQLQQLLSAAFQRLRTRTDSRGSLSGYKVSIRRGAVCCGH